jgi:hypothetical protein
VEAVVGSHNDRALITPLAAASDVVITAANVDDMEAAEAILDGMRQRKDQTGVAPILIHTASCIIIAIHCCASQHRHSPALVCAHIHHLFV